MAARAEVVADRAERLQEGLRVLGGLQTLQDSLVFAYRFFDIVVGQSSQGQDGGDCPFRWSYKVRPSRVTTEAM